jgi:hypothetical protein
MLVHNVYFLLVDNSNEEQEKLVAACDKFLSGHPGMVSFYVGRRKTEFQRDVNDQDFEVCLNIAFEDQASHDAYQKAERHFEFIELCKHNWKHVRVFDSCS